MGRRSRARSRAVSGSGGSGGSAEKLSAPNDDYRDDEGNVLTLRGSLSVGSRGEYARALAGDGRPATTREDAEQRALELLFERLAVRWSIAGAPVEGPKQLLARLRAASPAERAWVRATLRDHCAEHFPDVRVP